MKRRQRGVTLIGGTILVVVLGVFVLAALRLVPIYLEYLKVNSTLDGLRTSFASGAEVSSDALRTSIRKRFDIESVTIIKPGDVRIERRGDLYRVQAAYDHTAPFIGNVYLLARFNKTVEIPR